MSVLLPGDVINTTSHPRWYKIHLLILKWAIQLEQKIKGFKVWDHTHTLIYLGKILPSDWVWVPAKRDSLDFDALLQHEDWCFEVTWPRGKWTRWKDVIKSDWDIYRMRDHAPGALPVIYHIADPLDFSKTSIGLMRRAAWDLYGRHYDVGQLFNHIVQRLFGISRTVWKRFTDTGKMNKVCSAGVAYIYEKAKRSSEAAFGQRPWERPFRKNGKFIHIEATMPADYANAEEFMLVLSKNG